MKIYMDTCCYNRIFDDRSYPGVYFDRNSVMLILELVEQGVFELYGSDILAKEILDTPNCVKRQQLALIYGLCSHEVSVDAEIADRSLLIQRQSNIRFKDSLHLACAEYAHVDVLLTVDKKFMNNAKRIQAFVKVMTPTEWLLEVNLWQLYD